MELIQGSGGGVARVDTALSRVKLEALLVERSFVQARPRTPAVEGATVPLCTASKISQVQAPVTAVFILCVCLPLSLFIPPLVPFLSGTCQLVPTRGLVALPQKAPCRLAG